MPRLSKRLRCELLILTALTLGSCGRPAWEDRLDVADANARNAIAASSAMVDRVERLEGRVEDLEGKLGM